MARWNEEQKKVQTTFARSLLRIAGESGLTYTEMEQKTGLGPSTLHGLINGTIAPRVDHLPCLYKAFGEPVLALTINTIKETT